MARLLLVEDNPLNSDALGRLLTRHGHQVRHAPDGPTALAMVERELPDLILLDIGLPGMDGHTVARALRARHATRALPILALTAHATAQDREAALASGCDGFEVKPISMPRLLPLIQALLSGREGL